MRLISHNFIFDDATTVTASTENSRFPASNLQNYMRSKTWRSTTVATAQSVVFDLQTAEEVDSVVILWPKEDGVLLSDSATVTIQANATNTWSSPSISQVLTLNDTYEVMSYFWTTANSFRYWRVLIDDTTNPLGYISLGTVFLGKAETISSADNGFKYQLTDNSKITQTDFGNEYVDEYPKTATLNLELNVLDLTDIEILHRVYQTNGTRKPVYITLDETDVVFDKDQFAIYGKLQPSLELGHVHYQTFNTSLVIREVL